MEKEINGGENKIMKEVTMRELVGSRIVLAICIATAYWCWARTDWHQYYTIITRVVGIFAICFFAFLLSRERKYKDEVQNEMEVSNLRKCDAICLKLTVIAIIIIGFACAILRLVITTEVIGYLLMALLVGLSVIRTIIFCNMDAKEP